ncbi:MAG: sensor domain-containing diguanylate cyclase [Syntrophales bacterium]|nr:sensor domain-containing diguanylate cyclase [Syntrophales bacterium]
MAVTKAKIRKLIKMGDLLCSSFTLEEAYGVIGREMINFFPSGAFYRFNAPKNLLEAAAGWGDAPKETVFPPDDCLAVRRNRPHLVAGTAKGLPCPHIDKGRDDRGSMCIPMRVYGEFIGLLHVLFPLPAGADSRASSRQLGASGQLAQLAARQISLTLKNLQFREELSSMYKKDPLTGLINRRFLEDALTRELKKAQREEKPVAVVFMDIDHLGHINQSFGLEAGERIIKDLGVFLGETFQGKDMAARWGADEFVLVLPGLSVEAARRRAENLRETLSDHAARDGHRHMRRVTLSIGVAASPVHGEDASDLLQSARAAVRKAKTEGRDRVCVAE